MNATSVPWSGPVTSSGSATAQVEREETPISEHREADPEARHRRDVAKPLPHLAAGARSRRLPVSSRSRIMTRHVITARYVTASSAKHQPKPTVVMRAPASAGPETCDNATIVL